MNEEIRQLLDDIQTWMMDNDYECGQVGSKIYNEISNILEKYNDKQNKN